MGTNITCMKYSEWQIEVAKTNRAKISWKFGRQIAWTVLLSASVFYTDESTKFCHVCQRRKAKWSEGAHAEVTEKVCMLEHRRSYCLLRSIWLEKFPGSSVCWMEKNLCPFCNYSNRKNIVLLKDTAAKTGGCKNEICFFLTCYFTKL